MEYNNNEEIKMRGIKYYNYSSKETVKFKVISKNTINHYFKLHHIDDSIGLYDNDMNLIKTIKGII